MPSAPSCGWRFERTWVLRTKQNFLHFRGSLAHTGPQPRAASFRGLCLWWPSPPPGASLCPAGAEAWGGWRPADLVPQTGDGGQWEPHICCDRLRKRASKPHCPLPGQPEVPGAPNRRLCSGDSGSWTGHPTRAAGRRFWKLLPVRLTPPLLGLGSPGEMGPLRQCSGPAQGGAGWTPTLRPLPTRHPEEVPAPAPPGGPLLASPPASPCGPVR